MPIKSASRMLVLAAIPLLVLPMISTASEVLSLGRITLGADSSMVMKALGKPKSIRTLDGFIQRELVYDGLVVQFDEDDTVAGIESESARYCFEDWLCPGMAFDKAREVGRARGAEDTKGELSVFGDGCWIAAVPFQGKVKRVSLRCQP